MIDAKLREAIVAVIERSATFEERLAAAEMIAKPSPDSEVMAICRAVEASPQDMLVRGPIAKLFARVYATTSLTLPGWALALETLLAHPEPAPGDELALSSEDDETAVDLAIAFSGFLRTAGDWLDATVAASRVRITPSARRGLLAWLRRAWTSLSHHVLLAEARASGLVWREYVERLASRQGWLAMLASYSVLGRLLGSELELWQRECARVLDRLAADWTSLGETDEPALVDVKALALKRRVDAAPPLLVTLASGRRVVYHAKDLRIAAWFGELTSHLARGGLTPVLEPCPILARDHHAWTNYIEPSPCSDPAEVERYFTRVGMYLRLFQALRTVDMHVHNVIAMNEHPVFIDVETLFQPPRNLLGGGPAALAARERYDRSPLAVGLLPLWVTGAPGQRAFNTGGLNHGGTFVMPGQRKPVRVAPTVPRAGDKPTTLGEHLPQILAGYRAMAAALVNNEHVRAHLEGAANLRVAVLWRSFFEQKQVAETSLVPLLMTDGRLRDAFLTRLVTRASDDKSRTLALSELWAIRDGAVPSFEAQPASDAMYLADGNPVPGVFTSPALELVTLVRTATDEARDLDAIASAIGCEAQFRAEVPPKAPPGETAPADATTPLAHAIAIADFVLSEEVSAGTESLWLGAVWLPASGTRRIDVLPLDLLSGSAGIAVMFAYLYKRTGEPRFRDAATRALAPIKRDITDAMARGTFRGGAFLGAGGQLYALGKCGELLDDTLLLELVKQFLAAVSPALLSPGAPRDVVLGAAGLVLVAANVLDAYSRPATLSHIVEDLRQQPTTGRALYVDGERWLVGLPDEREGVAWALARWDGPDKPAVLPEGASLLTRIACAPSTAAPIDAFGASEPRPSLSDLVLCLAARDAYRDHALTDRASAIADAIISRRRETGCWLDDRYVAERHHLSAVSGLSALALAFARIDAPQLPCCARLVY